MLNKYVMYADLPGTVKGMLVRKLDEEECYTIVINSKLNAEQRLEAYRHELQHLMENDFDKADVSVDEIEQARHL